MESATVKDRWAAVAPATASSVAIAPSKHLRITMMGSP
jgi:hypothetical protein